MIYLGMFYIIIDNTYSRSMYLVIGYSITWIVKLQTLVIYNI